MLSREANTIRVRTLAVAALIPLALVASEIPSASGSLTATSNLMVDHDVAVTTRVTGVIESIDADRGQFVRRNQALATLDQTEFRLDLQVAEETYNLRKAELKRTRELYQQKLASQAELEEKSARFEVARVDLEKARLIIARAVVRAPFDGIVSERYARVGQKVLLEENTALFKITALEPLLTRVYFPEQTLGRLRVGQKVLVSAAEFPDVTSTGRITFLSPIVEPGSGSFQVLVTVPRDSRRILRPGMAVNLKFLDESKTAR